MMGLAPEAFWNMTVIEWRAALAGFAQARGLNVTSARNAIGSSELAELMQLYPDTKP
jgi:hypothetical protein